MALILLQPQGEPEFNMKALKATWDEIMVPTTAAAVEANEAHPEVDGNTGGGTVAAACRHWRSATGQSEMTYCGIASCGIMASRY